MQTFAASREVADAKRIAVMRDASFRIGGAMAYWITRETPRPRGSETASGVSPSMRIA